MTSSVIINQRWQLNSNPNFVCTYALILVACAGYLEANGREGGKRNLKGFGVHKAGTDKSKQSSRHTLHKYKGV